MPSDKSRTCDDLRDGYRGPVMQQGRVILDRDFNSLRETLGHALEADALDIVGPGGTPDNGFAIGAQTFGSSAGYDIDFSIAAGTMYVGGQRVVLPVPEAGGPAWSYFHQPDWLQPADPLADSPPDFSLHEFVYLHLFEQEVSAVEDPDLKDVALGGPDTTQRVRLMRRIERMFVGDTGCAPALQDATAKWAAKGRRFDPGTMRLNSQVALQVAFTNATSGTDPCDPVTQGGYLAAENQLIRVQISDDGTGADGTAKLLWGYDNASFLYRVTVGNDGKTVSFGSTPVDAYHLPRPGQVVEILRTAALLGDGAETAGQSIPANLVRCVAEATGEVYTLASGYDPSQGTVVLDQPLPGEWTSGASPLFLRVWQAQLDFTPGTAVELIDPTPQDASNGAVTTGLLVTITLPGNGGPGLPAPVGAFWSIAVRPSTPQAVYPPRFLDGPQAPDGPREWACPLAVIDWTNVFYGSPPAAAPTVQDCRVKFDNLVTLSNRQVGGGCCTVQVQPADVSGNRSLQDILDQFQNVNRALREVSICLMPGRYELKAPLILDQRHSNFTLEGCHDGAVLEAAPGFESAFVDGLIVLLHADNVTLKGLRFHLPLVPFGQTGARLAGIAPKFLAQLRLFAVGGFMVSVGVRALHCARLEARGCLFRFSLGAGQPRATDSVFGVGLFAGSECWGMTVEDCRFLHDGEYLTETTSPPSRSPTRTLVGIVVADAVEFADVPISAQGDTSGALLPALLDDGVLRNNQFAGLAIAVFTAADVGLLRLEGNRVRTGTYGFLLETRLMAAELALMTAAARLPAREKTSRSQPLQMLTALAADAELLMVRVLASAYPLPKTFSRRHAARVTAKTDKARDAGALTKIQALLDPAVAKSAAAKFAPETRKGARSARTEAAVVVAESKSAASATEKASEATNFSINELASVVSRGYTATKEAPAFSVLDALMARLLRQAIDEAAAKPRLQAVLHFSGNDLDIINTGLAALWPAVEGLSAPNVLISSNRMHGTAPDRMGIVTVYCPGARCVISGNVLLNDNIEGVCLAVFITADGNPAAAVTGNVVRGLTNLAALTTGCPAPVNDWSYANITATI